MKALFLIPKTNPPTLDGAGRSSSGGEWSKGVREFLGLCCQKEADRRPSVKELLRHRWVRSAGKVGVIGRLIAERKAEVGEMSEEEGEEEGEEESDDWDFTVKATSGGTIKRRSRGKSGNQVVGTVRVSTLAAATEAPLPAVASTQMPTRTLPPPLPAAGSLPSSPFDTVKSVGSATPISTLSVPTQMSRPTVQPSPPPSTPYSPPALQRPTSNPVLSQPRPTPSTPTSFTRPLTTAPTSPTAYSSTLSTAIPSCTPPPVPVRPARATAAGGDKDGRAKELFIRSSPLPFSEVAISPAGDIPPPPPPLPPPPPPPPASPRRSGAESSLSHSSSKEHDEKTPYASLTKRQSSTSGSSSPSLSSPSVSSARTHLQYQRSSLPELALPAVDCSEVVVNTFASLSALSVLAAVPPADLHELRSLMGRLERAHPGLFAAVVHTGQAELERAAATASIPPPTPSALHANSTAPPMHPNLSLSCASGYRKLSDDEESKRAEPPALPLSPFSATTGVDSRVIVRTPAGSQSVRAASTSRAWRERQAENDEGGLTIHFL